VRKTRQWRARWGVVLLLGSALLPGFSLDAARPGPGGAEAAVASGVNLVMFDSDQIRDAFLALLVGLLEGESYDSLSTGEVHEYLELYKRPTKVPVGLIAVLSRMPSKNPFDSAIVGIRFAKEIRESVPYSVLGYHPGSVKASKEIVLREWKLGSQIFRWGSGPDERARLTDVRLYGVTKGWIVLDIDAWVDKLLGSWIDDMRVIGFAVYRWKGSWHGMAFGFDPEGNGRSGNLDFRADRIYFPNPTGLVLAARRFRAMAMAFTGRAELPPGRKWK